jgi:murein DD-endopeptidase MepM/ murein hydrolase activator NlpD
MLNHSLIPVRGARRRIAPVAFLLAAAFASYLGLSAARSTASELNETPATYKWPVKPFDRQHPVRGNFGDPRTLFKTPPTQDGVMRGHGSFSLHRGIDISAPNGAPVYPVMSGVVTYVNHEWLRVDSANGHAFEYWHLHAVVRTGDRVEAYETVLGHVMAPAMHVHLTELQDERAVNPLAPGHIGPYSDTTTPRVTSIALRTPNGRSGVLPNRLRGRVAIVAGAEDDPTIDAPGQWKGLPVTPALLTWEIRTWQGRHVTKRRISLDFRSRLPRSQKFWQVYARGTYQNMAAFNGHYSWGQRGEYLFKLGTFDTRRLANGAYDLVVVAADTRGNTSSATRRFLVSR